MHDTIVQRFQHQERLLPKYREHLSILRQTARDKEVDELTEHIRRIESKEEFYYYILQVSPLLEAYREEIHKPIPVNFMGKPVPPDTSARDAIEKKYLQLIGHLGLSLSSPSLQQDELVCEVCQTSNQIEQTGYSVICKRCGTEKETFHPTFTYKDSNRVNLTTKYTYDRRIHFRDCVNQFQGKQNSTIPEEIYATLKDQFRAHGLVDTNYAPEDKRHYHNVTKQHVFMFLKELGNSKYYEDINLIYHTITGKPLPDISHLEEQLMNDFDTLSELYDEQYVKNNKIQRKNFINTHYVLFQLLRRLKYPCKRSDFNFLKTTERQCFHDEICSSLFHQLGWNFTNVF